MPLTRIFMFMKAGLQHKISADRSLPLWGLSLVPPPIPPVTTIKQCFGYSLLGFELGLQLFESKVGRPKVLVVVFGELTVPLGSRF